MFYRLLIEWLVVGAIAFVVYHVLGAIARSLANPGRRQRRPTAGLRTDYRVTVALDPGSRL
jgi:hypothetical protein